MTRLTTYSGIAVLISPASSIKRAHNLRDRVDFALTVPWVLTFWRESQVKVDASAHAALRRVESRGLRAERGVFFENNAQVLLGRSGISSGLQYHQRPFLEMRSN